MGGQGRTQDFRRGGCREGGGVPRSAKEANNPILLKVQSLQLSFRPAGVSLGGGGGGGKAPPGPPLRTPLGVAMPSAFMPSGLCSIDRAISPISICLNPCFQVYKI